MRLATNIIGGLLGLAFIAFVKVLELLGGVLVAVPKTRNLGLLILGPIIVNILCFHGLVMKGVGLFAPVIIIISAAALFLLWAERRTFAGLVNR